MIICSRKWSLRKGNVSFSSVRRGVWGLSFLPPKFKRSNVKAFSTIYRIKGVNLRKLFRCINKSRLCTCFHIGVSCEYGSFRWVQDPISPDKEAENVSSEKAMRAARLTGNRPSMGAVIGQQRTVSLRSC